MKIISISQYKGTTYEVEIDGGRKFYLHIDIIADYGITAGMQIERSELKKIIYASNFRRAYQYSLYCLDYRDYSAEELFEKLVRTYKNETLCLEVIRKLASAGLINDRRYAEKLARKFVEVRKYGRKRAESEMLRKGLDSETVRNALDIFEDVCTENLNELINTKFSRFLTDRNDRKSTEKAKNALVRLGYGFDEINTAVRNYYTEHEES
ncbi:MAG: RecX family transcriptional regulator [Ruminococcus sp.]|nr:RecX family transcriptional regulator [Ruminococcus sp.]MDE7225504.1 RecX family transcriptional regulator [Ruminococcus sp.]